MPDDPHRPIGRPPGQIDPAGSLRARLGAEIRRLRDASGFTLAALAQVGGSSSSHLSDVEHGKKLPSLGLVERLDEVLGADGALINLFPDAALEQTVNRHRRGQSGSDNRHGSPQLMANPASSGASHTGTDTVRSAIAAPAREGSTPCEQFAGFVLDRWPGIRLSKPVPDYGVDWNLILPGGRSLPGSCLNLQIHAGLRRDDGSVVVPGVDRSRLLQGIAMPVPALLVAVDNSREMPGFFMISGTEAQRQISHSSGARVTLRLPEAYRLDDLTFGLLWAMCSLDGALLGDDCVLVDSSRRLREYNGMPQSTVSRQLAPELSSVGQMWLASDFCARHILRHYHLLTEVPSFWTREQYGEEACLWMLFRHKHAYLLRTRRHFPDAKAAPLSRTFCLSEESVRLSAVWERILLFLSIALMESLQIQTYVHTEPEYSNVPGFVLAPEQRAIIANWIRADGLWYADMTQRRTDLKEFGDHLGCATSGSVIEATNAGDRLHRLAHYLGLDWPRLARRCAALAQHGCAGLVQPRSRLLSTAGVDDACQFVGGIYHETSAR